MFTDYTLKALAHLSGRQLPLSAQRLAAAITGLRCHHLQPALDRGWLTKRPANSTSPDKSPLFTITDAGESHIRRLVTLSESVPAIPQ